MSSNIVKLPSISELTSDYSANHFGSGSLTPQSREKSRFLPAIEKDVLSQNHAFTPRSSQSYNYVPDSTRHHSNVQKLPSPAMHSFDQTTSPQQTPYYMSSQLVDRQRRVVYPQGYYQPMYYQPLSPPMQQHLNQIVPEVINQPKDKCHRCGTTETPEWRRGPNGVRTLCNACGLFHAKLVKKKGAALAAEEVLNNKVCKGKNGRRISIKKQKVDANTTKEKNFGTQSGVKSITPTISSHQLVLPPIMSHKHSQVSMNHY